MRHRPKEVEALGRLLGRWFLLYVHQPIEEALRRPLSGGGFCYMCTDIYGSGTRSREEEGRRKDTTLKI